MRDSIPEPSGVEIGSASILFMISAARFLTFHLFPSAFSKRPGFTVWLHQIRASLFLYVSASSVSRQGFFSPKFGFNFHPLLLSDLSLFYSLSAFCALIGSEQLLCGRPVISAKRHLKHLSFFFTAFSSLPPPFTPSVASLSISSSPSRTVGGCD